MEEDIKILKEERDKLYGELECDAYDGDEEMTQHFTAKYNALNNILNRLEQLEEELEPIRELGIPVKTVVAELNRLEDLEDDREQMQQIINELRKDSIPKSVIREKIEELEKEKGSTNTSNYDFHEAIEEIYNNQIDILKELLGGSNE